MTETERVCTWHRKARGESREERIRRFRDIQGSSVDHFTETQRELQAHTIGIDHRIKASAETGLTPQDNELCSAEPAQPEQH